VTGRRGARRPARTVGPSLVWVAVVAIAVALTACGSDDAEVAIGDADHGRELFVGYGCGACHQVGGVRQAVGRVGPQLDGLADQRIIAGSLAMTPEHLAAFIENPQEHAPGTGMPDVGVSSDDAADIAAFLLERR
jgi:cytochrome c